MTFTTFLFTVTEHFAEILLLSSAVATIFVVPAPTAVTLPSESTFAIFASSDFQFTLVFVAVAGKIVAVSFCVAVSPSVKLSSLLSRVIPETGVVDTDDVS